MGKDMVSVELSISDLHSIRSVLKTVIREEKEDEGEKEVIETLMLLYEEIGRQLSDIDRQEQEEKSGSTSDYF